MAITPVPALVLASDFPTNADRDAGTWNAKAYAWAASENAMATRTREISASAYWNAIDGLASATSANQWKLDAEGFRNQAQTYSLNAAGSAAVVGRWDKLVLGPKATAPTVDNDGQPLLVGAEYYNTTIKARYSWNGTAWAIGTNVTAGVSSFNGLTGTVVVDYVERVSGGGVSVLMGDAQVNKIATYTSTTGPGADWPPSAVSCWWNVFTFGIGTRTTQIAQNVHAPSALYTRAKYDTTWTAWRPTSDAGQLTVTSSQTINRSIFGAATYVEVEMWGAGASGGAAVSTLTAHERAGGEGAEYVRFVLPIASLPSTISLVVGAGGNAVTATASGTNVFFGGRDGGATSFNGISAIGGSFDSGGIWDAGPAKLWLSGRNGGEGGGNAGPTGMTSRKVGGPGGSSVNGGAGGGGSGSGNTAGGTSTFGGNGGLGVLASTTGATAGAGVAPGGAGGGIRYNSNTGTATSGAGGRGEIRMRWW